MVAKKVKKNTKKKTVTTIPEAKKVNKNIKKKAVTTVPEVRFEPWVVSHYGR